MTPTSDGRISETPADHIHAAVRSALSAIPLGGGAAVELFNAIITPPIERRRREWMHSVGESLAQLQEKAGTVNVSRLLEDEAFVTLLLATTRIAIQTHAREKLDALRNAILNAASGRAHTDELTEAFLSLIDQLTVLHLRLLAVFHEGFVWPNNHPLAPNDNELPPFLVPSIGSYGPFLESDRALLSIVLHDLIRSGLIQHWSINEILDVEHDGTFQCSVAQWEARSAAPMRVKHGVAMAVDRRAGSFVTRTTPLGANLVQFISKPGANTQK